MMPGDRITVEQLVRIRVPRHELLIELTLEEANELFLGLQDVQRGILALRPLRLPMPARIPIVPTDEGLDRLAADLGVAIPVTEVGPSLQDDIEAMKAKADPWSDPNTVTNPAYWDCNCEDDYIHSKLESFCQRCNANREDQPDSRVCEVDDAFPRSVGLAPSNTPEPPAEPEPVPETSAPSNDRQVRATGETDAERAVRLWHSYRAKRPDELPNSAVGRVKSHLKHLSTPQIRELLRASGIDIPDPQSQAEAAAKARYAQAAKRQAEAKPDEPEPAPLSLVERIMDAWHQNRVKYPKSLYPDSFVVGKVGTRCKVPSADVRTILREQGISVEEPMSLRQAGQRGREAKRAKVAPLDGSGDVLPAVMAAASPSVISTHEGVRYDPLLDRFPEPPANLDVLDALALTWEILEESRPQISSFITTRVGLAATMAYKAAVEAMKPEYEAMAPFARREFKSAIAARWHKERAA